MAARSFSVLALVPAVSLVADTTAERDPLEIGSGSSVVGLVLLAILLFGLASLLLQAGRRPRPTPTDGRHIR